MVVARTSTAIAIAAALIFAVGAPGPAWAVPDYDSDGSVADDCQPLDGAVYPAAPDEPDLSFEDTNCDGVDGVTAGAFWVSTSGSDAGLGSKEAPFGTLAFAVAQASAANPKRDVYVQGGAYAERVELASGVSIYGGYRADGSRGSTPATAIQAPAGYSETVLAEGDVGVELQLLKITGPPAALIGESSYAIRAIAGSRLALTAVTAIGGAAGAGASGTPGGTGSAGFPGLCGGFVQGQGCFPPSTAGGPGGDGAFDGGTGGSGQLGDGQPGGDGGGPSGGKGGVGGHNISGSCQPDPADGLFSCVGRNGGFGGPGSFGGTGTGADFGGSSADGPTWANAAAATAGAAGGGGSGGGGGGAGRGDDFTCSGGGGGGGGGGGSGGTGGGPGGNGGGSFGLYLSGSSAVVDAGSLTGGAGGGGGTGGDGGDGGGGGPGGPPGPPSCGGGFPAGSGGPGGIGGQGGGGGGGAGGPSVGAFMTATSNLAAKPDAQLNGGTAGGGGPVGAGGTDVGGTGAGDPGTPSGILAQPGANSGAADFDSDGRTDAQDDCPTVPANTLDGCRARPAKLVDSDGDTVPDGVDVCPAEPGSETDGPRIGCNPLASTTTPTSTSTSTPTPTGTGTGAVTPLPRVAATVSTGFRATRTKTIFLRLLISEVPAGGTVELRCAGKKRTCPFKVERLRVSAKGVANGLSVLPKKRRKHGLPFGVGATLEVRVTAPGQIGKVVRYKIAPRKIPKGVQLCLPPGAATPAACAA